MRLSGDGGSAIQYSGVVAFAFAFGLVEVEFGLASATERKRKGKRKRWVERKAVAVLGVLHMTMMKMTRSRRERRINGTGLSDNKVTRKLNQRLTNSVDSSPTEIGLIKLQKDLLPLLPCLFRFGHVVYIAESLALIYATSLSESSESAKSGAA